MPCFSYLERGYQRAAQLEFNGVSKFFLLNPTDGQPVVVDVYLRHLRFR
jgi:hypothetical protein